MTTALPTYHPSLIERMGLHPRTVLAVIALGAIALLAFGLYLQHVEGLEPCPMCIVQRYALVLVALVAGLAALMPSAPARRRRASCVPLPIRIRC